MSEDKGTTPDRTETGGRRTAVAESPQIPPSAPAPVPVGGRVDRRRRPLVTRIWPWLLALGIGYLVVLPIGSLVYGALRSASPGTPDAGFTADWLREVYVELFTGGPIRRIVWNSIALAVPATVLATVLGVGMAWLITRTDLPGRRWFELGLILPLFFSPLVGIIGWTVLAAPGGGWLNYYWSEATGQSDLVNVYSFIGIVWVMALFYLPYAVIFNTASFRAMDGTLEEAASVSGAPRWRQVLSVTLPLMRPSIFASAIFVFIFCLEQFSIPGALGSQIRFETMAYSIYLDTQRYPSNPGLAAAKGTLLLVLTIAMLVAYRRMLRRSGQFVTVGSKARRADTLRLGRWRWPALVAATALLVVSSVLPLLAIVVRSLMSARTIGIDWSSLNLSGYRSLMDSPGFVEAARNSVLLSVGAAVVTAVLGLLLAVCTVRLERRRAFVVADYLISAPVALPGTVFGIGLLWAYIGGPLYQSVTLLLIAFVTRYAVFGVRMLGAGLLQVDRSLSEAALVSGASRARAVSTIDLPLLTGAMSAAWLLVFLSVMREVATTIIIYGVDSRTLAILTWNYTEDGFYNIAAALAVAQVVIVLAVVLVAKVIFGRRLKVGEAVGAGGQ